MAQLEIVSTAEVLSYLAKESESNQNTLDRIAMIKRFAERAVRRHVGASISQATYTHILPHESQCVGKAHLGEILRLPEYPVRSITSLYEDPTAYGGQASGAFDASTQLTAGEDFYLAVNQSGLSWFGHVVRLGTNWPAIGGCIKVVYTAGWSADELDGDTEDLRLDASDIKLATLKTIAEAFNRSTQQQTSGGTIQSENLDDWSVTYDTTAAQSGEVELPKDAKLLLRPFKRILAG